VTPDFFVFDFHIKFPKSLPPSLAVERIRPFRPCTLFSWEKAGPTPPPPYVKRFFLPCPLFSPSALPRLPFPVCPDMSVMMVIVISPFFCSSPSFFFRLFFFSPYYLVFNPVSPFFFLLLSFPCLYKRCTSENFVECPFLIPQLNTFPLFHHPPLFFFCSAMSYCYVFPTPPFSVLSS